MRISSGRTREFLFIVAAVVTLTLGASALIGTEQYLEDRRNHRHTQEETK